MTTISGFCKLTLTCLRSNTRKRWEMCLKLQQKIPRRRRWRPSGVFIVNFEHMSNLFLVFLLWSFKKSMLAQSTRPFCHFALLFACSVPQKCKNIAFIGKTTILVGCRFETSGGACWFTSGFNTKWLLFFVISDIIVTNVLHELSQQ